MAAFLCIGEQDYNHAFKSGPVNYITTVQTETLAENLYLSTFEELLAFGKEGEAVIHQWEDEVGPCLSMLDTQRYSREMHVQASTCWPIRAWSCGRRRSSSSTARHLKIPGNSLPNARASRPMIVAWCRA